MTVFWRQRGKFLLNNLLAAPPPAPPANVPALQEVADNGKKLPSVRPGIDVDITREPVGVIGIIAPWNFPFAIPAWKIAPALAHANTVVFKPAELVPACGWALSEIISRAALPG